MKRILLLLAVLGASLVLAAGVALAQATTDTQHFTFDISGSQSNPCTGELLDFTGTQRFVTHTTQDAAGNTHTVFRVNTQGSGTNPSTGETFLFRDAGGQQEFTAETGTETVFTPQATVHVISQGPSPDFLFHANYRYTVDAEGNIIDDQLENIVFECTGQTEPQ